jgi:hypothetical protein
MFHYGDASPYFGSSHPTKVDYSGRGGGDCDAPRGYTRRKRNICGFGAGAVPDFQPRDAIAIYDKGKGVVKGRMMYYVSIGRSSNR